MTCASATPDPEGPGAKAVRVLIVDDHPLVREGLTAVLELRSGIELVGWASDGLEAIQQFQTLRPEVTVMDLRLPACDGLQACRAIRELDPNARILILTSSLEGSDVRDALAAGAAGFLLKGVSGAEVAEAILRVHAGERPMSHEALDQLAQFQPKPASAQLTPRELEILMLVGRGLRNQEIAEDLGVALGTVKNHVINILDKMGARDRTEAATLAIKKGLIRL